MTDLTCAITIYNVHGWTLDPEMCLAVMKHLAVEMDVCKMIGVYPQERVPMDAAAWKNPGWCEWIIRLIYHSGLEVTMGAISRAPGARVEFHT